MNPVLYSDVSINDGFWKKRQTLNSDASMPNVYKRFKETGRIDAFACEWREGMPNKPHIFWDSDVAKWIEAAAYILKSEKNSELESLVDRIIENIEKNQDKNGYYNSYYQTISPSMRFSNRDHHELYCAGHLIEAAVAYADATGKDKFLKLMCKYADYIEEIFKNNHSVDFYTPGHEEIEMALVKLYKFTGERRYLELGKWFVDERGKHKEDIDNINKRVSVLRFSIYRQDHAPVRDMETAEGHAVRALYLFSAMADYAYEYSDNELLSACRKLFDNIVNKRMYITGGVGSTSFGEAFTYDYDLPNLTAYCESCASIALIFFCQRMILNETNAKYADVAERVLYNVFLSSTSLDGKSFFYVNPLEIEPKASAILNNMPITQRVEVFNCSCCPPNINRFVASMSGIIYTTDETTAYINQYISSAGNITVGDIEAEIQIETSYPENGIIKIHASGLTGKSLALRIPDWCRRSSIKINGRDCAFTAENGYAVINIDNDSVDIVLDLDMPVDIIESSPFVRVNAGKIAIQRGPVVYCAEGVDNSDGLWRIEADTINPEFTLTKIDGIPFPVVEMNAYRCNGGGDKLYSNSASHTEPCRIRLIPYFAFANRGESEMEVWIRKHR